MTFRLFNRLLFFPSLPKYRVDKDGEFFAFRKCIFSSHSVLSLNLTYCQSRLFSPSKFVSFHFPRNEKKQHFKAWRQFIKTSQTDNSMIFSKNFNSQWNHSFMLTLTSSAYFFPSQELVSSYQFGYLIWDFHCSNADVTFEKWV